jgi:hypothetical protein
VSKNPPYSQNQELHFSSIYRSTHANLKQQDQTDLAVVARKAKIEGLMGATKISGEK